jgi:hypothetical protein
MLARLSLRRTTTGAWQEAGDAVGLDDALAAAALAREAQTPFGLKRPAGELLDRFGGDSPEGRRRATAALALAGVAADPPLVSAEPSQWIQLRRAAAAAPAAAAPSVAPAPEPAPAPTEEPPPTPRRTSWAVRTAAKHAPTGPVTRERRFAAGALGLVALLLVMVGAVVLRNAVGDDGGTADALPTTTTAAAVAPATTPRTPRTTPPPATTRRARPRPAATPPAARTAPAVPPTITQPTAPPRARPRTVRLVIAPTEPSYVCIADGRSGATVFEGMLTGRYAVSRASLILRVGVATARIGVDGRPLTIDSAPSAYRLTPAGVSGLPDDRPVCGA